MTWKLFIDDIRNPVDESWEVARSSKQAIQFIKLYGMPIEIAFDHDLGGDDIAIRVIDFISEELNSSRIKIPKGFKYSVHSVNSVGRQNIDVYMSWVLRNFTI